jgi:hypothetical protein
VQIAQDVGGKITNSTGGFLTPLFENCRVLLAQIPTQVFVAVVVVVLSVLAVGVTAALSLMAFRVVAMCIAQFKTVALIAVSILAAEAVRPMLQTFPWGRPPHNSCA